MSGENFNKFIAKKNQYLSIYSKENREKQHSKGKLTARERIDLLFDENTFQELDSFAVTNEASFGKVNATLGDGVITGYGKVNGRLVYAYSQDMNVMGGSLGSTHANKIMKVQKLALKTGAPIIGIQDSGGARIQEGVKSLDGYAGIFFNNVKASGVIPQISVIVGPCAGGAVYSPALTDFIFMVNHTSSMFVTGPSVIKEVLNEDVTMEELGGAMVHSSKSGVSHFAYEDEESIFRNVRKLLSYIPSNNIENPPHIDMGDSPYRVEEKLRDIIPEDTNKAYDIKEVISLIVDNGKYYEIMKNYAQNIITCFTRLNGKTIGVVANQPKVLAGTLDINSSLKSARFIRFCDAFNIPILVLEDVPGFLPGVNQEHNGIIKHGAKLLYALADSSVPRITVILRKAYGGAYCVLNSKPLGGDFNFAWPNAEIAVMGHDGAIAILYKKELSVSENASDLKKQLEKKYKEEVANPYVACENGMIDEVIDPAETRVKLIIAFEALESKHGPVPQRKHGNIPL